MSNRTVLLVSLAGILAAPAAVHACLADVPLEIIAGKADLIVIAEAINAGQTVQLQLKQPGMKQARLGFYRKYNLKVARVIKEKGAAPAKPKNRNIEVLTSAPRPRQPGAPMLMVSDQYFASLQVGTRYVLVLHKLAGKPEYFLPAYPKNYALASDAAKVKAIEAAADVSKWAWGAAGNGLQIALKLRQKSVTRRTVTQRQRQPNGRMGPPVKKRLAYLNGVIALRNTSTKAITVSLYPADKFLSLAAVGPGGRVVRPDWYKYLAARRPAPFGPTSLKSVRPGKVIFISAHGSGDYGLGLNLALTPGKWLLHASYRTVRQAKSKDGQPVWAGEIHSRPVELQVK